MDSNPKDTLVRTTPDRIGLVVFVLLIWSIAAWMFWIVNKFADGKTWWDFAVKLVLHDLIFSIVVFGCALMVHACWPSATLRIVEMAAAKLSLLLWAIIALVATTLAFAALVVPLLMHFGVIV